MLERPQDAERALFSRLRRIEVLASEKFESKSVGRGRGRPVRKANLASRPRGQGETRGLTPSATLAK